MPVLNWEMQPKLPTRNYPNGVSGGWQFWLEDHGRVRQFMVAKPMKLKLERYCGKTPEREDFVTKNGAPGHHSDAEYEARRTLRMGCS
jgi:hypothetical protein